jgi:hypothetical protein
MAAGLDMKAALLVRAVLSKIQIRLRSFLNVVGKIPIAVQKRWIPNKKRFR